MRAEEAICLNTSSFEHPVFSNHAVDMWIQELQVDQDPNLNLLSQSKRSLEIDKNTLRLHSSVEYSPAQKPTPLTQHANPTQPTTGDKFISDAEAGHNIWQDMKSGKYPIVALLPFLDDIRRYDRATLKLT